MLCTLLSGWQISLVEWYVNVCASLARYSQLLLHDLSRDLMLISKKTESCRLSIAAVKLGFTKRHKFHRTAVRIIPLQRNLPWSVVPDWSIHRCIPEHSPLPSPPLCSVKTKTALRKRRKSMAQTLKEVFRPSACCCPLANPPSPS